MKSEVLRSLACVLLVLSAAGSLRADRDADRRNERIPPGHKMHAPLHKAIMPAGSPGPTGYTPQQLRHAYGFDQLNTTGQGQIIAIVDAYGSSTIQADLNTFCTQFGIPSTTVQVYYPQGTPGTDPNYPGWATETSLDVEWAHAIAPGATIALIVAQTASSADLYAAVDYAVSLGAKQISMSWTSPEYSTEGSSDYHFNVSGVTFFAASGDSGAGVNYPACSPYVVGVGGTTLHLDSSNNISSETAWSGSGGGPSVYETVPSYQAGWWNGSGRGVPDVAYDGDPNTGVPVYLTASGWGQWGGTSMAAPQWAALSALANSLRPSSINSAPGVLYSLATANYAGYYHDITSGSNGAYSAGVGYDLVTGLGTPLANQLVVALAGGFSSQTAAPVFFPGAGNYSSAQNVTIASATPGASIRYTTDGSIPTETTGTLYFGPVSVGNTTLKAIAYESGDTDSTVSTAIYVLQATMPTFSPAAGTYAGAQTVTISTTTTGASMAYTTDGSTPTESGGTVTHGTLYSGAVSILATTTLKAIAYEIGYADSPVASGTYTITQVAAPVFSPPAGAYTSAQSVTISSATSGASIRYTTNGSTPTQTVGTHYTGPVNVGNTPLKAIAYKTGLTTSTVTSGTYTIVPQAAVPTFSPVTGTYTSVQSVTISTTTTGASIAFTTDGTTPTETGGSVTHGTLYSGAISVGATTTIKAVAFESGYADSGVGAASYTINLPQAATPTFNPPTGTYIGTQSVAISSSTGGASIAYTTDGTTPTESGGSVTNGTLLSNGGSVSISASATLKAIAFESGYTDSGVATAAYTINVPIPTTVEIQGSNGNR